MRFYLSNRINHRSPQRFRITKRATLLFFNSNLQRPHEEFVTHSDRLLLARSLEMRFGIKRKVLSGFRQFEAFNELIFVKKQIRLASAPPRCNVLNAFAHKNKLLYVAALSPCSSSRILTAFTVETYSSVVIGGL